jgi:hypothetical protein
MQRRNINIRNQFVESKVFNHEINKFAKVTLKNMSSDSNRIKESLDAFSRFLDGKYNKNKQKIGIYLKRYSYLKYKDGYSRNIMIGIVGAFIFLLGQEFIYPLSDMLTKQDIGRFISPSIAWSIIGVGLFILTILFAIFFLAFVCYQVILFFDKEMFSTFSNPSKEILIQMELKVIEKLFREDFDIKI